MNIETALEDYLSALKEKGAAFPLAYKSLEDKSLLSELSEIEEISIPEEFLYFVSQIDGYDQNKCREHDFMEPVFAWNREVKPLSNVISYFKRNNGTFGDKNYFPSGFVTFLWGAGGDDIVINCIANSPTFGSIYFFQGGVGVNLISNSLTEFLVGCKMELDRNLIQFEDDPEISVIVNEETYFEERSKVYGNTPYFNRKGKFDTQIIDWK